MDSDIRVIGPCVFRTQRRMVEEQVLVCSEELPEIERLACTALMLLGRPRCRVAVIGLGMGILPRLLYHAHDVTAFEIEPKIVELFRDRNPLFRDLQVIEGDYRSTMGGWEFDVVVYDVDGSPPEWLAGLGEVIVP